MCYLGFMISLMSARTPGAELARYRLLNEYVRSISGVLAKYGDEHIGSLRARDPHGG